jgi:hypothetical protein
MDGGGVAVGELAGTELLPTKRDVVPGVGTEQNRGGVSLDGGDGGPLGGDEAGGVVGARATTRSPAR